MIRFFAIALCVAAALGCATTTPAAHSEHGAAAGSRPIELWPGLGHRSHPITTASPEAQAFFDQGLTLLWAFNHDEAARSFRRASEFDPDAAMPYWGFALAIGPNYNDTAVDAARARATFDAVRTAQARAARASEREQDYVRAVAKRYASPEPSSDWLAYHRAYSDAMRALVAKYPDDLDAAALFAESLMMLRPWQLWSASGEPAPGTLELVAALESVMRRDPNHPGANHFYIHAVEASKNLERAIPSAQRLMQLVPGAGHLVHMPGHIYLQTGDYELAAATNVAAAEADRVFVAKSGATGMYPLMYWTHNHHFVAYARAQQGRYAEALEAARAMVANSAHGAAEMQMLEGFLTYPLSVMLAFRRADAVLAEPAPAPELEVATAFWRYARAVAYAWRGERELAQAAAERFRSAAAAVPDADRYLINNSAAAFLAVAGAALDAELAAASAQHERSIELWQRAESAQARLEYDEPPPWYEPIALRRACALLRAGRASEAESAFRTALDAKPRDGRLLFGLWQSLLAQGRANDAALVERRFREAWSEATEELVAAKL